jgi:uncharacterized protein with von Willebrand factor type A (vWA) domain
MAEPCAAAGRTPALAPDLASLAALFVARLHAAALPVGPEHAARFARVVAVARPATVRDLYWCARVTLVSGEDQLDRFDAVFHAVFGGRGDVADQRGATPTVRAGAPREVPPLPSGVEPGPTGPAARPAVGTPPVSPAETPAGREPREHAVPTLASREERLATTDFAALSPLELAELAPLLRRLALVVPERRSRRRRRSPTGDRVDVRATLRRCHRSGGDPARTIRRRRRRRPRQLVVLLDVSGSMEPYARAYLQLLWGAAAAARAETFLFATRLTRVTRSLRTTNPSVALARAARLAPDWSGGTRIGLAVKAFLDRHGRRGMARGAVVVMVSDGWERDDPALLGAQMAALARLAERIVWVNPRVAASGFAPRAGGMAAALPHVDALVAGNTVAAMGEVLDAIAAPRWSRRLRDGAARDAADG